MVNPRLALRTLTRTPFVTLITVLSLALGIGANAAIFSFFDQILLKRIPVYEPGQLVNLSAPGPKPGSQSCNQSGDCEEVFSYRMFRDLEERQTVLTGLAAHRAFSANLAYKGNTSSTEGSLVSGSYFPVLGLRPAAGRLLTPEDDKTIGAHFVAVISYSYWETQHGLNPAIIGDIITINGQSMTVVGVAPKGFEGTTLGNLPRVFVPISMRGFMSPGFAGFENRRNYWAYAFGRLKPGVSLEQATKGLNALYTPILTDVEAPLQQGMSEQTDGALQGEADPRQGGSTRPEQHATRGHHAPADALLHHRYRPAHRLREHRQPAPRPRRQPRDGDGGQAIVRCVAPPVALAAADGGRAARAHRRRGQPARGQVDRGPHQLVPPHRCRRRLHVPV
jgi:hypothetical protein